MNKFLSQAIKKAVSEFSPTTNNENNIEKSPDLFVKKSLYNLL